MPYILNVFPIEKARLISTISTNEKVEPLCRIIAEKINEKIIQEEDLDPQMAVTFKFLKEKYLKCFKVAPDDRFI
jgi:hypothetical protein